MNQLIYATEIMTFCSLYDILVPDNYIMIRYVPILQVLLSISPLPQALSVLPK